MQVPHDKILQLFPQASQITMLAGGVVSTVCQAVLDPDTQQPVVVKCTHLIDVEDSPEGMFFQRDFDRLLMPAPDTHLVDLELLLWLQQHSQLLVPEVLSYDRDNRVTVMRDFRLQGFTLLQDLVVAGAVSPTMGVAIGRDLARLVAELRQLSLEQSLVPAEKAVEQLEERSDELRTTLGYDPEFNIRVESILSNFLHTGAMLVATDTHPKNMAIAGDQVMFFDFGRTIFADPRFTLPNFCAHLGLAWLGGCLSPTIASETLRQTIEQYQVEAQRMGSPDLDEAVFVEYFLMELLHRGKGARWIDQRYFQPVGERLTAVQVKDSVGLAVEVLGKRLLRLERESLSISDLFDQLEQERSAIEAGRFVQYKK